MRHILQAFTVYIGSEDFGYDTEEVTLPVPTPLTEEYRGGGMHMAVNQPMSAIEPLEATFKMAGHSPDILKRMALGPGRTTRLTVRGAVRDEPSGNDVAHVAIIEGAMNGGSHDTWQRGQKSGLEFVMNGIIYFKYEVADEIIHECASYPPVMVVNGVDQLLGVNQILGIS